jgi:hypothetical protein
MPTTESTAEQAGQRPDHDRELLQAITHALVLAVGKRAAGRAVRRARAEFGHTARRRAVHTAAHLAGYSTLIGYIWHQRRTSHSAA